MSDSVQPPAMCHTRHEAIMFAGIISQHLPAEMTAAEMEAWRHDPEGLAAVLAGLLPAPKLAEGLATAPLHVGTPPRSLSAGLNGTSASDLGGGTEFDAQKGVALAGGYQRLEPLMSLEDDASAARIRQTRRSGGAEPTNDE
jgi:hypothetical protein